EVLQRDRLPAALKRLIVAKNDEEANAAYVVSQGAALPLTKRDFDKNEKAIREVIYREFDLDPEEPQDQRAIEDIVSWFRSGAREPLQFQKRDVVLNVPAIAAIAPIDFVVPAYTTDLEHTDRITEVLYVTERELK